MNVDDVSVTDQLATRASRPADYQVECRALATLAQAMAQSPETVLRKLVEVAMQLTQAQSAGISLLEGDGEARLFRWVAMAGAWSPYLNGVMPFHESPCGAVLKRGTLLVLHRPERAFPALRQAEPPVEEGMLTPFLADDGPAGTVWVVKHTPGARFEQEDARLLESLAHFAAAAHRLLARAELARAGERQSRAALRQELNSAQQFQDLIASLVGAPTPAASFDRLLQAAMTLMRADAASIQVLDASEERLSLLASREFHPETAAHWRMVGVDKITPSALALRRGERFIIPDSEAMADIVEARAFRASGLRSCQTTPLRFADGRIMGALTTHWRQPYTAEAHDYRFFDVLARLAAELVERERAVQHMTDSERRFRTLAETAPALIWRNDAGGRNLYVNQRFIDYTGLTEAEIQGEGWHALVHPDEAGPYVAGYLQAVNAQRPWQDRNRIRSRQGEWRWFENYAQPLFESDGSYAGHVGVSTDIHDSVLAEQALRESEERLSSFVNTSTDVLWMVNAATGQLEFLSPAYEAIWGEPRDRVMGEIAHWATRVHPEDRAVAGQALGRLRQGERLQIEYRIIRPDGGIRHIIDTGFPIRRNGEIVRLAGVAQDLTARHLAERAVAESERRARTLMEGVPQLVWRAASASLWSWASPQWTHFTGQAEADALGLGWLQMVHPEDRKKALAAWSHAEEAGGFDVEHRLRRHDGAYAWFSTRASPVRDETGAITEWLGTCTDINDLRVLQERQKIMVAELQHRTRNLIGVIRSIAARTMDGAETLQEFEARFSQRLMALSRVQGLLSRLGVGRRVTFDELLRSELLAMGAINEAGEGERVFLEGPEGVELRSATVQTFALALHELATNATKYGAFSNQAEKGRLTVLWHVESGLGAGPSRLHVIWWESGVPMPEQGTPGIGYGRELIEQALPYQLDAETSFEMGSDGVRATISVPIAATKELR